VTSPARPDVKFSVRFWGVRGSIASPGPRTARYGGNTSSLEVRCGERLLLFDAGTGIRTLGKALEGGRLDADLFFTHTHFDHVCGLPFFRPFFEPGNRFRLWAGHLDGKGMPLKRVLSEFMMSPLFPVPPEIFHASIEYRDFRAGDTLAPAPGIAVKTAPLNHPDGATGYRVEYRGRSLCYLTDTEHVPGKPDRNVLALMAGADLVIYDCMYTDEEYPRFAGWGHSTWQEAVRLCREARARRLAVFHHDPDHDDDMLDGIAREVEKALPGSVVASEGLVLEP
jgi:phosphoribosyl 1,2-cyclic phosphodiesterase